MRITIVPSHAPLHAAIPGAVYAFFFLPPRDRHDLSALFPRLTPRTSGAGSPSPEVLSRKEKTLLKAAAEPVALKEISSGDCGGAASVADEEDEEEKQKAMSVEKEAAKEKVSQEEDALAEEDVSMAAVVEEEPAKAPEVPENAETEAEEHVLGASTL